MIFGDRSKPKDVARSRLAVVLQEDRTAVPLQMLALMQLDLLTALSAHAEIVRDDANLSVEKDNKSGRLMLHFSVPLTGVKRRG